MTLTEMKQDLFTVDADFALAHCISSDYAMGAGIAVKFTQMGVKNALMRDFNNRKWNEHGCCLPVRIENRLVYNLVTKERYWQKPTYQTMRDALEDMKRLIAENDTHKIAMPLIGCGLDRLNWNSVKETIKDVFADTNIEIIVCKL